MKKLLFALIASSLVTACAPHKVATSLVSAPFKIVGGTVDALTTSQKEADLKRGRAMRKQEERDRKEAKKAEKYAKKERKKQKDNWN
jgi:hypothetical protein